MFWFEIAMWRCVRRPPSLSLSAVPLEDARTGSGCLFRLTEMYLFERLIHSRATPFETLFLLPLSFALDDSTSGLSCSYLSCLPSDRSVSYGLCFFDFDTMIYFCTRSFPGWLESKPRLVILLSLLIRRWFLAVFRRGSVTSLWLAELKLVVMSGILKSMFFLGLYEKQVPRFLGARTIGVLLLLSEASSLFCNFILWSKAVVFCLLAYCVRSLTRATASLNFSCYELSIVGLSFSCIMLIL